MSNIQISKTKYRMDRGNIVLFYDIEIDELTIANKGDLKGLQDLKDLNILSKELLKYIEENE